MTNKAQEPGGLSNRHFSSKALSAEANVTISSIEIHADNLNASEKKALSRPR
jgi:hypothetical protein